LEQFAVDPGPALLTSLDENFAAMAAQMIQTIRNLDAIVDCPASAPMRQNRVN